MTHNKNINELVAILQEARSDNQIEPYLHNVGNTPLEENQQTPTTEEEEEWVSIFELEDAEGLVKKGKRGLDNGLVEKVMESENWEGSKRGES